jgi:hypothetical protein
VAAQSRNDFVYTVPHSFNVAGWYGTETLIGSAASLAVIKDRRIYSRRIGGKTVPRETYDTVLCSNIRNEFMKYNVQQLTF